jgi:hypothetical protein
MSYRKAGKRLLDLLIVLPGLLLLAPVFLLFDLNQNQLASPVFQTAPCPWGRYVTLLKLDMQPGRKTASKPLEQNPRCVGILPHVQAPTIRGHASWAVPRRWSPMSCRSCDVLWGEMSPVGPRQILDSSLEV